MARHFHPQADRPVLQVPVAHIAAMVELVARDFRQAFAENVPWGKTVTPGQLLWWKTEGRTRPGRSARILWQINRVRRLCMRPGTALVQELQDHWGQNLATKSVGGLKQWAIDYCVTKAGDYAIQLYSGGFVLDDEYRPRISAEVEAIPFDQEPLQVLVVGQVKSGKSSLINALLGELRAPVDTLPLTDAWTCTNASRKGCRASSFATRPAMAPSADEADPFSRLGDEIQECDLLLLVCTARSAARQADRELLRQDARVLSGAIRSELMPPVVCVLTHVDTGAGASGRGGRGGRGGRSGHRTLAQIVDGLRAVGPAGQPGRRPGGHRRETARGRTSEMSPLHPADPQRAGRRQSCSVSFSTACGSPAAGSSARRDAVPYSSRSA